VHLLECMDGKGELMLREKDDVLYGGDHGRVV
jgi:hypothetical protein